MHPETARDNIIDLTIVNNEVARASTTASRMAFALATCAATWAGLSSASAAAAAAAAAACPNSCSLNGRCVRPNLLDSRLN